MTGYPRFVDLGDEFWGIDSKGFEVECGSVLSVNSPQKKKKGVGCIHVTSLYSI